MRFADGFFDFRSRVSRAFVGEVFDDVSVFFLVLPVFEVLLLDDVSDPSLPFLLETGLGFDEAVREGLDEGDRRDVIFFVIRLDFEAPPACEGFAAELGHLAPFFFLVFSEDETVAFFSAFPA